MSTRTTQAPRADTTAQRTGRFRPDVEGLRALAIGLVLWFHAGLPYLTGGFAGVDVFFVISGFLITGLLVREIERSGRISLPRFYARRAKRLLPAAAATLVGTAVLTFAFIPKIRWQDIGGDIAASAGYVINWRLALRAVNYLAEDSQPSPVQHFWSLAVEEQYYIIWPLLLILLAVIIRRRSLPVRPVMATGLLMIVLPSLAWSVVQTNGNPAAAYFITTTRLWELGIGALVAVGTAVWTRIPQRAAIALGWTGLGVVVAGALTQTTSTPWPGTAAVVPVLGTAAVIVAGSAAGAHGPVALLGRRPMVVVGGLSYSLYLWHWPLLVAATAYWGGLTSTQGLAVAAFSFVPAWLTHRYIENPFRYSGPISRSPRLALSIGASFSLVGVASGLVLVTTALNAANTAPPATAAGAAILGTSSAPDWANVSSSSPAAIVPNPLKATTDVPELYAQGCQVTQTSSDVASCTYGPSGASFTVAVVGDSKVAQWVPALRRLATKHNWRIVTYTKSSCAWNASPQIAAGRPGHPPYPSCDAWGAKVLADLTGRHRPDLVLTSAYSDRALASSDAAALRLMVKGYVTRWRQLQTAGIPVVAIADSPTPNQPIYACVAEHPKDYQTTCTFTKNDGSGTKALREAAQAVSTARLIDLNNWVCPGAETCPPVVGNVLVYRQGSHITATYVDTLAPVLDQQLQAAMHRLGIAAA